MRPPSVVGHIRQASAGDLSRNSKLSCTVEDVSSEGTLLSHPLPVCYYCCYSDVVANQNLEPSLRVRFLKPKLMIFDAGGERNRQQIARAFFSKLNKISDAGTDFSESELKKLVFLVDLRHGGRRLSACTASRSSPNPASCNPLLARPLFCLILWLPLFMSRWASAPFSRKFD